MSSTITTIMDESSSPFVPALLVIDMQHDFVHGSLAIPNAASLLPTINTLLGRKGFKVKMGTKDWHPENHVSFAKTHGDEKEVGSRIRVYEPSSAVDGGERRSMEQVLWPVHCVENEPGSEFVRGLDKAKLDGVVLKGVDADVEAYSGFRDVWGGGETGLGARLKEEGISDVYIVGVAGDYCVGWTAEDAVKGGWRTWVVRDGVGCVSSDIEYVWDGLRKKGVRIVDSAEVLQRVE